MSVNHGTIWWSELMTRDVPSAMAYYSAVCGWTFEEMPFEGRAYTVATAHGRPVAGIRDMSDMPHFEHASAHWFTYLAVDDLEAAMEATLAAGGETIRAPFDVPDVGRIAMFKDPTGAAVGLMHPVFPGDALVAGDLEDGVVELPNDEENFPI